MVFVRTVSGVLLLSLALHAIGCREPAQINSGENQAQSGLSGVVRRGENGGYAGRTDYPESKPSAGENIIVRDARGKKTIAKSTSDKDGRFEIHLQPGMYKVEAIAPVCTSYPRTVEVREGKISRVDLEISYNAP